MSCLCVELDPPVYASGDKVQIQIKRRGRWKYGTIVGQSSDGVYLVMIDSKFYQVEDIYLKRG